MSSPERWSTEANEATQTHCYNPVVPTYPVWAYYAHGWQRRCQGDLVSFHPADWRRQPGRPHIIWLSTVQQDLKQHHFMLPKAADLAQNRPLWRMMSTYGSTQYAILELHARNDDDEWTVIGYDPVGHYIVISDIVCYG